MKHSFEVGVNEVHEVEIEISMTGKEVYRVDGVEVLSTRSFSTKSDHTFEVGDQEKHQVRIVIDTMPSWKSLINPTDWKAQVYVDDELFIDDLTPELRDRVSTANSVMNWLLLASVIVLAVIFAVYQLVK